MTIAAKRTLLAAFGIAAAALMIVALVRTFGPPLGEVNSAIVLDQGDISDLRVARTTLTWQTSGETVRGITIGQVQDANRKELPPDIYEFKGAEISPSRSVVAFQFVRLAGERGGPISWNIGVASRLGEVIGTYTIDQSCYLYEFAWTSDSSAVVLRLAPCRRVLVLTPQGTLRADIATRGVKGILLTSPDSKWVAIDDGPSAGRERRIEFLSIEEPGVRSDRDVTALAELGGWRRPMMRSIDDP